MSDWDEAARARLRGDGCQSVTTLAPVVFLAASRVPRSVTLGKPALRMTALAILGWSSVP